MATAPGLDVSRVAEILVDLGRGEPGRRGSGYRVSAVFVLTAAHVVLGASSVRVRFDADQEGEWSVAVKRVLEIPETDVALLEIQAAAGLTPALFGGVGERDAVITCSAVGFPLWKLREDERGLYRDSAHVTGGAAVLANRREGTLEICVPPPEPDSDPDASPWEGMSGAAVFCSGRIVGIVGEHHRSDGLGRLAVSRADRWHSRELCVLLPGLRELADVIPPSPAAQVAAGYLAQVRDIAPDPLMNRADELAELVAFCAGPDRYQWWQGPPQAGKTALASWFVLHPPDGVRTASFFITSGLADQSDSAAFTEAMIDQLAALAGEPVPPAISATARDGLRRHLLTVAADHLRERGERLVLVVDGLDEDSGNRPGSSRASIASLLPRQPPDGVRVLVTSREHPPVPADVAEEHPLRACRPRALAASPYARESMQEAENELRRRLHAGGNGREILALIAAAGGGLTAAELCELTGSMQFEIEDQLGTVLGRSLSSRPRYEAEHERAVLFAHETLQAAADKILRPDLSRYRDKIHAWADTYRAEHWPPSTPGYLLRSYGRLLSATGDLDRLATLAAESTRHDRMLEVTRSDLAAQSEITLAQDLLLASSVPDLSALLLLAAERHRLGDRTEAIPFELPAAWARLGNMRHALELARSFVDPGMRATALARIALALTDEPDRVAEVAAEAEQVACTAYAPAALRMVALAVASTNPDRALRLISWIAPDPWEHLDEHTAVVQASAGRLDIAERSASRIAWNSRSARFLAQMASHFARSDLERAIRLADRAEQHVRGDGPLRPGVYVDKRIEDMASVASALAETDPVRARLLADDALRACLLDEDAVAAGDGFVFDALSEVVVALAAVGRPDQAEIAARTPLAEPYDQTNLLAVAAEALARSHPARAVCLAEEAEHMARGMPSWPDAANPVRGPLAEALVIAGRPDLALQVADNAPYLGPRILAVIASALVSSQPACSARLAAQAEQAAHEVSPDQRFDRNRALRARALAEVAQALAGSHPRQAERLMTEAKQTVPRFAFSKGMDMSAQDAIADAFAATGEWTDAFRVVRSLSPTRSWESEARVVEKLTQAGEWDQAEVMARAMTRPDYRSQALADIARALADSQHERAVRLLAEADEVAAEIQNDALRRAVRLPITLARWSVSGPTTDVEHRIRRLLADHLTSGGEPRLRGPLDHADGLSWEILPVVGEVAPDAVVALHEWTLMQ